MGAILQRTAIFDDGKPVYMVATTKLSKHARYINGYDKLIASNVYNALVVQFPDCNLSCDILGYKQYRIFAYTLRKVGFFRVFPNETEVGLLRWEARSKHDRRLGGVQFLRHPSWLFDQGM